MEIRTGVAVPTPLDWGFTMTTNAEQSVDDLDGTVHVSPLIVDFKKLLIGLLPFLHLVL
jgi:hypothetical protein